VRRQNSYRKADSRSEPSANKPFIAVNCADLALSIIEVELFGYEKEVFTGVQLI